MPRVATLAANAATYSGSYPHLPPQRHSEHAVVYCHIQLMSAAYIKIQLKVHCPALSASVQAGMAKSKELTVKNLTVGIGEGATLELSIWI